MLRLVRSTNLLRTAPRLSIRSFVNPTQTHTVFIGNLPYAATPDDLRAHVEKCGPVENVKIITDRETRRSKGYGFVTFSDPDSADNAVTTLNGKSFMGRDIFLDFGKDSSRRE